MIVIYNAVKLKMMNRETDTDYLHVRGLTVKSKWLN